MNNVLMNVFQSVYMWQHFDNINEIVDKIRILLGYQGRAIGIVIITRNKSPFFFLILKRHLLCAWLIEILTLY